MHLSRYIKQYQCRENPERILLFSTRSLAKIVVPAALLQAIEEGNLSPREQEILVRNGFLVADRVAERREMLSVISEAEEKMKKAFLMTVLNLDCNLACRYCYEGAQRGKHFMSPETAVLLTEFAEKHWLHHGKDLCLELYGGEPLLSLDLVRHIAGRLTRSAAASGREFTCTLVTNGTLLTKSVVRELTQIGLKRVRVTLDGPRENHDCFRPCVSGAGSFDVIVGNLKEISCLVDIGISGNFTRDNYRDFPLLLDYLAAEGLTPAKVSSVQFGPVVETLGEHFIPEFSEGCVSSSEAWLMEASLFLREEILRRGFFTPRVAPTICMIELRDNLVVYYDGTLYKCPAFIGCEGLAVGRLESGVRDYRESHALDVWKKDTCLECPYLPLCFGGCRFLKLLRDGALDGVDCRKAYFDATLEELVLQDLRFPRKIHSPRCS